MEWSPYMRESGIREIFACGIRGILGFGFRNTAKEIQLKKSGIQNPSSTDIKSEASSWNPESLAKIQDCLVLPYVGREWVEE